jgi:DNA-binding transcriptional LysR family regulator
VVSPYLALARRGRGREALPVRRHRRAVRLEIDVLVTPDPLNKPGLRFEPVFDYEQVLVVAESHRLAAERYVKPEQLVDETLITYPVETDRLDIYNQFLRRPASCRAATRPSRPPTSCCRWSRAGAAWPRCRSGSRRNTPIACRSPS